ncbi:PilZ domain-containing protein [Desulfobulbus rhabdoformis]|uniref:PilZ domain-containing protein n=1 Tax=Desulfobulbus rhabdoformis TaxID=34032 RepID=UPI0019667532|nr:PilZ domain-containing protein [Desulfobulbus rhabdoformis]MBM9613156.1 PilZ domain-containing protein [Desulfobulbus rhabdoformis]
MRGRTQTCTVKDGRIRITCSNCRKRRYVAVPGNVRRKSIRCHCGLSTTYNLNHRVYARESTCGKGFLLLANGRECPVYLCDISLGGIGFNIPPHYARTVSKAKELRLKYRSGAGSSMIRRIRITSLINNRAGAEFIDGKPPSLF